MSSSNTPTTTTTSKSVLCKRAIDSICDAHAEDAIYNVCEAFHTGDPKTRVSRSQAAEGMIEALRKIQKTCASVEPDRTLTKALGELEIAADPQHVIAAGVVGRTSEPTGVVEMRGELVDAAGPQRVVGFETVGKMTTTVANNTSSSRKFYVLSEEDMKKLHKAIRGQGDFFAKAAELRGQVDSIWDAIDNARELDGDVGAKVAALFPEVRAEREDEDSSDELDVGEMVLPEAESVGGARE